MDKYFTLIDFNAHKTNYYTYILNKRIVKLFHHSSIDIGLLDVINYIENNNYSKYIDTIKNLYYFAETSYRNITQFDFFKKSPLSQIIKHYVDFKHKLLDDLSLNGDIWIKYSYENIAPVPFKHIEMNIKHFNSNCDMLLINYEFIESARNKTLKLHSVEKSL